MSDVKWSEEMAAEMRALFAYALPLPWGVDRLGYRVVIVDEHGQPARRTGMRTAKDPFPHVASVPDERTAQLVARAPMGLRAAMARIEELEAENAQLRTSVEALTTRLTESERKRDDLGRTLDQVHTELDEARERIHRLNETAAEAGVNIATLIVERRRSEERIATLERESADWRRSAAGTEMDEYWESPASCAVRDDD